MSCYRPLIGVPDGTWPSGKIKYNIRSSLLSADIDREVFVNDGAILIPCGKCIGCRLDYSREWANRLMMELQYHDSAYFVTLTYNDDHIPQREYVDKNSGEVCTSLSTCKRDFQLFMKRLRKEFSSDHIRFYACSDYGSDTFRPHYHAIIFGLHLDDLKLYKKSFQGHPYYTSDRLQRVWSVRNGDVFEPIGFAVVADVTWESCAYTARYVTRKLMGKEAQFYTDVNIESPWSLMSRKPGIAYQYYLDHPEGMLRDNFVLAAGRKIKPPRYFDKMFDIDYPEESDKIKNIRKSVAQIYSDLQLAGTDLCRQEYLALNESVKLRQTTSLRRCDI